jgi:putative ABC transport system ATP-binding protein
MTSEETMANDVIIRLQNVSKVFETDEIRTHALEDVDLSIARGDYLAVSGPSGCGKSTLLSILGLLDQPTSGQYWLNGQDVTTLSGKATAHARNRQIGFIFQSFNLLAELSVAENVELPLRYRAMSPTERAARVQQALDRVGMAARARHYPSQLSGGQQQRVAVARAVAGDPAILLADEPTGNLDSRNGEAVMQLLAELHAAGATICIVTHDPRYAEHAGRIVHLHDGRLVENARLQDRDPLPEGIGLAASSL